MCVRFSAGCFVLALASTSIVALPAYAIEIIGRVDWGAKPPTHGMHHQIPARITVHHTAVPANTGLSIVKKLRGLQAFSQSKGKLADGQIKKAWPDVPYHFYIAVDGKIAEGRPVEFVGDTNTAYNAFGHITIVVEGNFQVEQPSIAELSSLKALIGDLMARYKIAADKVGVHRDFVATDCPGVNLEREMAGIIAELAH